MWLNLEPLIKCGYGIIEKFGFVMGGISQKNIS